MANMKQAVFIKVGPGKIKVQGRIISENEKVIGSFDVINGLPGMHFIGYKDYIDKAFSTQPSKETDNIIRYDSDEIEITVESNTSSNKEPEEKTLGFNNERLKELKAIKPGDWVKKKKSEFIEILKEGNIDYSAVKDDRMALYKFLVGILEEL